MAADPEINLVDPDVYLRSGAPHELLCAAEPIPR